MIIDMLILAVIGVVTWCVASEGAWGALFVLLSVVFACLLAMNFFEPLATFLEQNIASQRPWMYRWDFIALLALFCGGVAAFRSATEYLVPRFMHCIPAYEVGRWGCGLLTGYATAAFLLTAVHTAALPREFLGFQPRAKELFQCCGAGSPLARFHAVRFGNVAATRFAGPYFRRAANHSPGKGKHGLAVVPAPLRAAARAIRWGSRVAAPTTSNVSKRGRDSGRPSF